jgi:hypothetical protein
VLDIIVIFVEHLLSLGEETISFVLVDDLLLCGWHLECSLFIEVEHSLLSCFGCCHGGFLLFLEKASLLDLSLLGLDLGCRLHALELVLLDNGGLGFLAFFGLLADVAQLLLGECSSTAGLLLGIP